MTRVWSFYFLRFSSSHSLTAVFLFLPFAFLLLLFFSPAKLTVAADFICILS